MPQSVNVLSELNSDAHPLNTADNVMVDALNLTLTTKGENQLIAQNMTGNSLKSVLTPSYRPLAVTVFNDIAYIVSGKFDEEGVFVSGEIGCYPSPDWDELFSANSGNQSQQDYFLPLKPVYSPLRNFSTSDIDFLLDEDKNYIEPFNTSKLNFRPGNLMEMEAQPSYDGSVNLIITDDYNPIRLVNTRFKLSEDGKSAGLADRNQVKDTNTYSEKRFSAIRLIKQSDIIPKLIFNGVYAGGSWLGGDYRFYFRYIDSDGSVTDIIEESRNVQVSFNGQGANPNENTGKYISFTIDNLDKKFSGVKVYYSYASGGVVSTTSIKEIVNIFPIPDVGALDLNLYGNEDVYDVAEDLLNIDYSAIDTAKTITQHDDRLVLGNITNEVDAYSTLSELSKLIQIQEDSTELKLYNGSTNTAGYADPDNVYHKLGVWAGETYEVGICYILKNGRGVTPAFGIRGGDNYNDDLNYTTLPTNDRGFVGTTSENTLGIYRTSKCRQMTSLEHNAEVRFLKMDVSFLSVNADILELTDGFFFVRKERKKDCLIQGITINTAKQPIPSLIKEEDGTYDTTDTFSSSALIDIRKHIDFGEGKIVPAPGRMTETTITEGLGRKNDLQIQGKVSSEIGKNWAFYSSDALVDPVYAATIFGGSRKGLMINDNGATEYYRNWGPSFSYSGLPAPPAGDVGFPYQVVGEFQNFDKAVPNSLPNIGSYDFYIDNIPTFDQNTTLPGGFGSDKLNICYTSFNLQLNSNNGIDVDVISGTITGYIKIRETNTKRALYIQDVVWDFMQIKNVNGDWYQSASSMISYGDKTDDQVPPAIVGNIDLVSTECVLSTAAAPNIGIAGIGSTTENIFNFDTLVSGAEDINSYNQLAGVDNSLEGVRDLCFRGYQDTQYNSGGSHHDKEGFTFTSIYVNGFTGTNQNSSNSNINLSNTTTSHLKIVFPRDKDFCPVLINDAEDNRVSMSYIPSGNDAYSDNYFSSMGDRNIYYLSRKDFLTSGQDQVWNGTNGYPKMSESSMLAPNSIQYSDYIGIKSLEDINKLKTSLENDSINVFNFNYNTSNNLGYTDTDAGDWTWATGSRGIRMGVQTNVYESELGVANFSAWKAKYSNPNNSEKYFSISKSSYIMPKLFHLYFLYKSYK